MKPTNDDISQTLDRLLARHKTPSPDRMQSATRRVAARLRADIEGPVAESLVGAPEGAPYESNASRGVRWIPAVAAAAILAVAIGTAIVWPRGDGALYRVVDGTVQAGGTIQTNGGGAQLTLVDGSRVEMRSQSELSLERADDGLRIRLNKGGIIVNAADQRTGHLYVQTKDVTVSVVGTVFLVNATEDGSRVAVIEGEVHVRQGALETTLMRGDHLATNPAMEARPVREAIAWSRNASALVSLLQQSAVVPPAIVAQSPAAPVETFEVASVRLRAAAPGGGRGAPVGAAEPKCYGTVQIDPRRFSLTNMMLYRIITLAYGKSCYGFERMDLLSGGPGWVTADRFDIEATIPDGTPSSTRLQFDPDARQAPESSEAPRLQAMLQALLADRFKLVVRRQTRETSAYVLTVANGGHKLTPWKEGEPVTMGAVTGGPNQSGEWRSIVRGNKLSVPKLANQLTIVTGRPVVDRTGITGDFNYGIEFAPMNPPDPSITRGAPMISGPSLFTALEETLGLRLEATRVPVEVLVIERVERPSEN